MLFLQQSGNSGPPKYQKTLYVPGTAPPLRNLGIGNQGLCQIGFLDLWYS